MLTLDPAAEPLVRSICRKAATVARLPRTPENRAEFRRLVELSWRLTDEIDRAVIEARYPVAD